MAKQMEKESRQKERTMIPKEPNGLLGLVWNRAKGFAKVRFESGHLQHVAIRPLEWVLSFTLKTVSGNFSVNPYWLPPVQFVQKRKVQDPHPTLVPPTTTQWAPVPYPEGAQGPFSNDP